MNNQPRYIRIHFQDSTQMTFSFPQQVEQEFVAGKIKALLTSPQLVIETSERFYVFPWTSIKFIEGMPISNQQLHMSIQNAELIV